MYETIRMQILDLNIALENGLDNNELIGKLVLSNITLLRELGVSTSNEDYTDLAHILTEVALQSNRLDKESKDAIHSLINNEEGHEQG